MRELNQLVANDQLIQHFWRQVSHGSADLALVAPTLRQILETDAWRKREIILLNNEIVEFGEHEFAKFIQTKPLRGCGWPLDKVEALIKDDPELLTMWRRAITGQHGGDRKSVKIKTDNISLDPKHGTSRAYTLARLERERPDLYERILAKELSANAAATIAGWRPSRLDQLRRAWRKASAEERRIFLEEAKL
jgi:hypothetical protein